MGTHTGPEGGSEGEGTESSGPEQASAAAPEGGDPVPEGPRTPREVLRVLVGVGSAYLRRLVPLLVVLGVPAAPVVLMAELGPVWPTLDILMVNAQAEPLDPPGTALWVFLGVNALLGLLLAPIGLGGALALGSGALLGRRISVPAAWHLALRRYPTTLVLLLALLAWIALFLGLLLTALFVLDLEPLLAGIVLLPPALYTLPPLVVALPVALLEGRGPFRAVAAAWWMGRFRRLAHLVFVALAFGLGYLVSAGMESLVAWASLQPVDPLVPMAATALVTTLVAPLWPLLVSAPVALVGPQTPVDERTRDLDRAAVERELPRTDPAPVRRPLITVPLLALAVLLPPVAGPLTLWAADTPQLRAESVDLLRGDEATFDLAAQGDRAHLSSFQRGTTVLVCDPDCSPADDRWNAYMGGATQLTGSGFVDTAWKEFRHEDAAQGGGEYAPHEDSGLYLRHCADLRDGCSEDEDAGTLIRPYAGDHYDLYTAIAPLAEEGLVVASHARPDTIKAREFDLDDRGGLRVQVCEDTECADPHTVVAPEDLAVGAFLSDGTLLDAAASPDGGFAVSAYDGWHGGISLVHCPDAECAEPEVTQVVSDSLVSEYEGYLAPRFGARIEYRPDGTPVIAYRAAQGGAAHVVDCHDAACAESTDRAVTGKGWARPAPGLALDSHGNPQLATFDMAAERVVLVSCLDQGCAETDTVPLRGFEEEPAVTALTLDDADRPHLVWAQGGPEVSRVRSFRAEAEYVHCLEPRCGARAGEVGDQTP